MTFLSDTSDKPTIGITLGDYNGIGPEVILKTLADNRITKICTPVIYGSNKILLKYKKILELEEINFQPAKSIENIIPKKVNIINCWEDDLEIEPGKVTTEAGRCAYLSLNRATEDILAKKVDAIVTAPINKKNIQSPDFKFAGHTEYFAAKDTAAEHLMLMISDTLRVGVVTGHIPLGDVKQKVTKETIVSKINILYKSLKNDFQILKPRLALLGLNPHAGEEGLLGTEENDFITPLVEELKNKGILIYGPLAADGFFGSGHFKKFDGVLAMYHDQGLIPFKTLAFEQGVNFTAGLSFVDRKSTRLNSSHSTLSRMPSSA